MSEAVARAVGAESGKDPIVIAGKPCKCRGLGIGELCEVERKALELYRESYLKAQAAGLQYIPGVDPVAHMTKKVEESSKWDISDLPPKYGHDPKRLKLTDAVLNQVKEVYGLKDKTVPPMPGKSAVEAEEIYYRHIVAAALDAQMISETDYVEMVGEKPVKFKIPYTNWWITGCYDGIVTICWVCFRAGGVSREEVAAEMLQNPGVMINLAKEIEKLSAPKADFG